MKKSVSFLIAMAIMAFSVLPVSANTNGSTPVSGTYKGSIETKSFFDNNTNGKSESTINSDIQLLFNGNVFIYQNGNEKCMGNYTIQNNIITFTVTSTKGNVEKMNSIFSNSFKYSKSGNKLMLISNDNTQGDVFIYTLSKSNS